MEKIENQQLLVSAANGDVQGVIKAVSNGANINVVDANGYTSLHCAVYNNHLFVVQILVEAKADVNVRDTKTYDQWTPLHYASAYGRLDIVKALLKTEQDPHVMNGKFQTPSDLASTPEIKQLLEEDQKKRLGVKFESKVNPSKDEPILQPPLSSEPIIHTDLGETIEIPQGTEVESKKTKFMRILKLIGVLLFFFFPTLFLLIDPYQFPWFIFPCGFLFMIAGLLKLSKYKEWLKEKNAYALSVHGFIFLVVNTLLIISNIWSHGYPWSFFVLSAWGLIFIIIALKTTFKDSKKNKPIFIHLLVYIVASVNLFIIYSFTICRKGYCESNRFYIYWPNLFFFLPIFVWGVIVILHFIYWRKQVMKEREDNKFDLDDAQPQYNPDFENSNVQQTQQTNIYQTHQDIQPIYDLNLPTQQQNIYPNSKI